jgi:hypothetical protein
MVQRLSQTCLGLSKVRAIGANLVLRFMYGSMIDAMVSYDAAARVHSRSNGPFAEFTPQFTVASAQCSSGLIRPSKRHDAQCSRGDTSPYSMCRTDTSRLACAIPLRRDA